MPDPVITLAAAAPEPLLEGPAIDAFKNFVNAISVPELSLPIFTLLFVLMFIYYRVWTKPPLAAGLGAVFCVLYFGSMFIDSNYFLILAKPDNVPISIMLLATGVCVWVAFRQAAINDAALAEGRPLPLSDREDKTLVWPDLVYTELICLLIGTAVLVIWSVLLRAPLEAPANPAGPPNPSKAPWYFLGLQEMLVYYDPWMAGVLLPGMIVTGLIGLPYYDTNPRGNGYYTLRERPFAIFTWLFGFLILWVVLIVFGTFLRGPNWNFFGPYEYWDSHMQVPLTNINLSEYFWTYTMGTVAPENPILREIVGILFLAGWIFILPGVLAMTVMRRLYLQMGSLRFGFMAIHLVILLLLPLKMVLRWLFTLKYFVSLPEFNLNF